MYISRSPGLEFLNSGVFQSPKLIITLPIATVQTLMKSHIMWHFDLGLHLLSKYLFTGIQNEKL